MGSADPSLRRPPTSQLGVAGGRQALQSLDLLSGAALEVVAVHHETPDAAPRAARRAAASAPAAHGEVWGREGVECGGCARSPGACAARLSRDSVAAARRRSRRSSRAAVHEWSSATCRQGVRRAVVQGHRHQDALLPAPAPAQATPGSTPQSSVDRAVEDAQRTPLAQLLAPGHALSSTRVIPPRPAPQQICTIASSRGARHPHQRHTRVVSQYLTKPTPCTATGPAPPPTCQQILQPPPEMRWRRINLSHPSRTTRRVSGVWRKAGKPPPPGLQLHP